VLGRFTLGKVTRRLTFPDATVFTTNIFLAGQDAHAC
jgi:hypothetical protein